MCDIIIYNSIMYDIIMYDVPDSKNSPLYRTKLYFD